MWGERAVENAAGVALTRRRKLVVIDADRSVACTLSLTRCCDPRCSSIRIEDCSFARTERAREESIAVKATARLDVS